MLTKADSIIVGKGVLLYFWQKSIVLTISAHHMVSLIPNFFKFLGQSERILLACLFDVFGQDKLTGLVLICANFSLQLKVKMMLKNFAS